MIDGLISDMGEVSIKIFINLVINWKLMSLLECLLFDHQFSFYIISLYKLKDIILIVQIKNKSFFLENQKD